VQDELVIAAYSTTPLGIPSTPATKTKMSNQGSAAASIGSKSGAATPCPSTAASAAAAAAAAQATVANGGAAAAPAGAAAAAAAAGAAAAAAAAGTATGACCVLARLPPPTPNISPVLHLAWVEQQQQQQQWPGLGGAAAAAPIAGTATAAGSEQGGTSRSFALCVSWGPVVELLLWPNGQLTPDEPHLPGQLLERSDSNIILSHSVAQGPLLHGALSRWTLQSRPRALLEGESLASWPMRPTVI